MYQSRWVTSIVPSYGRAPAFTSSSLTDSSRRASSFTILFARRRFSVQTLQMVRMSTPISSACERMRTLSVR